MNYPVSVLLRSDSQTQAGPLVLGGSWSLHRWNYFSPSVSEGVDQITPMISSPAMASYVPIVKVELSSKEAAAAENPRLKLSEFPDVSMGESEGMWRIRNTDFLPELSCNIYLHVQKHHI